MKAFTDIEQSKKLAEILPTESADQTWERRETGQRQDKAASKEQQPRLVLLLAYKR